MVQNLLSFMRLPSQDSLDPFFQTQKDLINIFHTRLLSSLVSRRLLNVPPPSITSYIVYKFLFLPLQIDIYMKQFLGSLYKPPAIPCMYLILVCTLDYIYIALLAQTAKKWKTCAKINISNLRLFL